MPMPCGAAAKGLRHTEIFSYIAQSMASKRKRTKGRRSKGARPSPGPGHVAPARAPRADDSATVGRLIAEGRTKTALERARAAHRRLDTPETEATLVDAYLARAASLAAGGQAREAGALLELVRERFPAALDRVEELARVLGARHGDLDELVRPLADPATPAVERAAIEEIVRNEVTDLARLAASPALDVDDPLRRAAAEVNRAFEAVTRGKVEPQKIALPQVSRRSPLAPWKMLVRALDAFYRGDDDACERTLAVMESAGSGSGPAPPPLRVAGALRALLCDGTSGSVAPSELSRSSAALVARVRSRDKELRQQLERLERAFAGDSLSGILSATRQTLRVARRNATPILPRLRQHVFVRSFLAGVPPVRLGAALDEPVATEACFWRLLAQAADRRGSPVLACAAWEQFRLRAAEEGLFEPRSREEAAIYLYMAELMEPLSAETLEFVREDRRESPGALARYVERATPGPSGGSRRDAAEEEDFYYLRPEELYARAIRCDADPETFRRWLEQARRERGWKAAEEVALQWHARWNDDPRPLLHLVKSAEKRGAFRKALKLLEQAEGRTTIDPEVRRARPRLLVAAARRHLRQKKPHLVEKDVAALAELPASAWENRASPQRFGDASLVLDALRWACSTQAAASRKTAKQERKAARQQSRRLRSEIAERLESDVAALLLLRSLSTACGFPEPQRPALPWPVPPRRKRRQLASAVARAAICAGRLGVEVDVPSTWGESLCREVSAPGFAADVAELVSLAETAFQSGLPELTYTASGAGLAGEASHHARFLLLRARSLPSWEPERAMECLAAAVALARRQRDTDLLAEVADLRRDTPRGGRALGIIFELGGLTPDKLSLSREELDSILRREQQEREYPSLPDWDEDDDDFVSFCTCPECTRRRRAREAAGAWDDEPWDDEPWDGEPGQGADGFAWGPIDLFQRPPELEDVPQKLLTLMMEASLKCGTGRGRVPGSDTVARVDPDLYVRLKEAIEEHFGAGGIPPHRPPASGSKSRRRHFAR